MQDPDIIVIGAGPNGLTAGCVLARAGFRVLLLEAHPHRVGGAVASEAATLPGFIHDVGAAFFPFAQASPAFQDLDLPAHGLTWCHAPIESAHPAPDGSLALISRDPQVTLQNFGSERDGLAWNRLAEWHQSIEPRLMAAMLKTIGNIRPLTKLLPFHALKLAWLFLASGRRSSCRLFKTEAARRVLPGLALHTDVGPDDWFGSGIGYMLGLLATTGGYGVPKGGAGQLSETLLKIFQEHSGQLMLGSPVESIIVRKGKAVAVRLTDGGEISAKRSVFANTAAPTLFLKLLQEEHLPAWSVRRMKKFVSGWGTFKVDWALSGPVPWTLEECRRSAVVHAGDSLDDLSRFTSQVRSGALPDNPYLVIGQQSVCDPSRAPTGNHTLWTYSRVPSELTSGVGPWTAAKGRFADIVEQRIEAMAPGFRQLILTRKVSSPDDLQQMDANLIGGDLGGGSNAWHRQLIFRPLFPYFRYRMPIRNLYLCSSYSHPGAGVHGMCGYNAAQRAIRELQIQPTL